VDCCGLMGGAYRGGVICSGSGWVCEVVCGGFDLLLWANLRW
jgi:hypothetical protein